MAVFLKYMNGSFSTWITFASVVPVVYHVCENMHLQERASKRLWLIKNSNLIISVLVEQGFDLSRNCIYLTNCQKYVVAEALLPS